MKKIIYSLVIMIAAGSLFTSCIQQEEPEGIKNLRQGKVDYLASLAKVREADAEYRRAEAAVQQAIAAIKNAKASQEQAIAKAKELANEAQKVQDEVDAAQAKADIEGIRAKAEQDAADAAKILAQKQAALEEALKKIAAEAIGLTSDEAQAITDATNALNGKYSAYNTALTNYNNAVKDLWNAEYNVAAGVAGYETADTYKALKADFEEKIAKAEEKIATLEALKEDPSKTKDEIDAIDAQIQTIKEQKQININKYNIYKASTFTSAKREYEARWNKFVADSLGGSVSTTYSFKNADGTSKVYNVNKKYDGVQNIVEDMFANYANITFGAADGYSTITVNPGTCDSAAIATYLNGATTPSFVFGLKNVVSALQRELVVVNNDDSLDAAAAAEKAFKADSIYWDHKAIILAGLEEYQPYKDSLAVKEDLRLKDSTAKAISDSSLVRLAKAEADTAAKKAALVAAVKNVDTTVVKAAKALYAALEDIREGGWESMSGSDSAVFINAIKEFGAAQAATFDVQDSITFYEGWEVDASVSPAVAVKVAKKYALSELTADGFKQYVDPAAAPFFGGIKAYSRYGHENSVGWYFDPTKGFNDNFNTDYMYAVDPTTKKALDPEHDPINKVFAVIAHCGYDELHAAAWFADAANFDIWYSEAKFLARISSPLKDADTFADSLAVVKNYASVSEAKAALDASNAYAKKVNDTATADYGASVAATTAYQNYQGVAAAELNFKILKRDFFGNAQTTHTTFDLEKFSEKSFLEPFNCVVFTGLGDITNAAVAGNATLTVVLKEAYGYDVNVIPNDANHAPYFRGTAGLTEFAQKLYYEQYAYMKSHYTECTEQLANIAAAVDAIEADFIADYAAWKDANAEYDAIHKRLCGVDENGNRLLEYNTIDETNILNGEWNLGGYQKEWADELAGEFPALYTASLNTALDLEEDDLEDFKDALDKAFVDLAKVQDPALGGATDVASIIAYFDSLITAQEADIAWYEGQIEVLDKAIAACEAGYSPAQAIIDGLKANIAKLERKLKQAEEALKIAQKEYDDTIAAYGVK